MIWKAKMPVFDATGDEISEAYWVVDGPADGEEKAGSGDDGLADDKLREEEEEKKKEPEKL